MKKKPHKLPWELHDPKLEPPYCGGNQPLDLSDQPHGQMESPLPKPEDVPVGRAEL